MVLSNDSTKFEPFWIIDKKVLGLKKSAISALLWQPAPNRNFFKCSAPFSQWIKMAQIWYKYYWVISQAMLRIRAFLIFLKTVYYLYTSWFGLPSIMETFGERDHPTWLLRFPKSHLEMMDVVSWLVGILQIFTALWMWQLTNESLRLRVLNS